MGFFGRLIGRNKSSGNSNANQDYPQDFSNDYPQNNLSSGLQGFSPDSPPSFEDDFSRTTQQDFQSSGDDSYVRSAYPEQTNISPEFYNRNPGAQVRDIPQNNGYPTNNQSHIEKDLEIISNKLDFVKSSIENMDQRLRKIEKLAEDSQEKPKPRWQNF